MNPQFPIYIVSKNRWRSRLTVKALEFMKVPYKIIVEESDYENYATVIDKSNILILPTKYQDEYITCDEIEGKSKGAGPARNFAWDHSLAAGYAWHWVMDDNLDAFHRMNRNIKAEVNSGTI